MINIKSKKIRIIVISVLIDAILVAGIVYGYYNFSSRSVNLINNLTLKTYTKAELSKYNGTNPNLPIYIGLDGYVYDVSSNPKMYGIGGTYHYLAGTDTTSPMMEMFGAATVKKKYKVVGILK